MKSLLPSIRQRIRYGDSEFTVTASSWPIFLYAKYTCDMADIAKGLFRSTLLLKVWESYSFVTQLNLVLSAGIQVYFHFPVIGTMREGK
jgi:hypothetical protein